MAHINVGGVLSALVEFFRECREWGSGPEISQEWWGIDSRHDWNGVICPSWHHVSLDRERSTLKNSRRETSLERGYRR